MGLLAISCTFAQENASSPPRDEVVIVGDGNTKGFYFLQLKYERDVAAYTIQAVDDPRTLGKVLHIRPPANIISFYELVALWEKKIDKTLRKIYISEDQLLQTIQDPPFPNNFIVSLGHAVFVEGIMINCDTDPSLVAEAIELYP